MNNIPNPESFAQHVLWHLTGLRADMLQMQSIIFGLAAMLDCPPDDEVKKKWVQEHMKNWKLVYQDALSKCNLPQFGGGNAPIWPFSKN
jgi:hypothetical protein